MKQALIRRGHCDKCCTGNLGGRDVELERHGGVTASSIPDDTQGLSRWAETWSPFRRLHCDSQQVSPEHHWKSISLCSLIARKRLPCLQHHIMSQDSMTFIYFCFFLPSSSITLSCGMCKLTRGLCNRSWILFWGFDVGTEKSFLINLPLLKASQAASSFSHHQSSDKNTH